MVTLVPAGPLPKNSGLTVAIVSASLILVIVTGLFTLLDGLACCATCKFWNPPEGVAGLSGRLRLDDGTPA